VFFIMVMAWGSHKRGGKEMFIWPNPGRFYGHGAVSEEYSNTGGGGSKQDFYRRVTDMGWPELLQDGGW